jgi:hypothetical protein
MRKVLAAVISTLLLISISACSEKQLRKAYGMKPHYHLSPDEIKSKAQAWGIDTADLYSIDTSIISYLYTFGPEYSFSRENHIHPLQAIYYNKEGKPVSFITGAFADAGLRNLSWNPQKNFEVFPPRTLAQVDNMFTFSKHLAFLKPVNGAAPDSAKFSGADYNVLVMYAEFTGRQTRRFFKEVIANKALNNKYKVNYIFVNTDGMYPEDLR